MGYKTHGHIILMGHTRKELWDALIGTCVQNRANVAFVNETFSRDFLDCLSKRMIYHKLHIDEDLIQCE